MTDKIRKNTLKLILKNINKYGHHIHLILGGNLPRFAYTIGASQLVGSELIFAGASFYSNADVKLIINGVVDKLRKKDGEELLTIDIDLLGSFSLCKVDASWVNMLMLGAVDFYNTSELSAIQIVPERAYWTIDTPNLEQSWKATAEPVWQWMNESWDYPVSEQSMAITNLNALRGEPITEVMRWEDDEWEMFSGAGPDVLEEDIREVPLGVLLGSDRSLNAVTTLLVGQGLWRSPTELVWHSWGNNKE